MSALPQRLSGDLPEVSASAAVAGRLPRETMRPLVVVLIGVGAAVVPVVLGGMWKLYKRMVGKSA